MVEKVIDQLLYSWYKDRLNLELKEKTYINLYKVPKTVRGQFNEMGDLVLFDHPKHYDHLRFFQYDYAFQGYFSFIGAISILSGVSLYRKHQSVKSLLALTCIGACSFLEGYVVSKKVNDVRTIILRGTRSVIIKTWQNDEETEIDLENLVIVNKNNEELVVLMSRTEGHQKKFRFFFLEPCYGTVSNMTLFNAVIRDKRALKF